MSELIKYLTQLKDISNGDLREYHEWFLENGKLYNIINKEYSNKLSKYSKIKQCFNNCIKLSKRYKKLEYIEGYTHSLIPIEHGFMINNKNEIIDPTLAILDRFGSEYFGILIPQEIISILRFRSRPFEPLPYVYWRYLKENKNE